MKFLDCIDSTQKYIKKNNTNLVISKKQTNGYGVSGVWDGLNENLYFSKKCKYQENLWVVIIVSIYQLCYEYSRDVYIKIPNDIYIKDMKLAGFIIEKSNDCIVGIGLNVYEPMHKNRIGLGFYNDKIDVFELGIRLNDMIESNLNCKSIYNTFKYATNMVEKMVLFKYKGYILERRVIDFKNNKIYFEDFHCFIEQIKLIKWNY